MASETPEETSFVYTCQACGHIAVGEKWGEEDACPRCGADRLKAQPVEANAIRYSIADRRGGPSIEDGRLGRMAYFAGWMSPDQVAQCLHKQWRIIKRGQGCPKFGELTVRYGFLNRDQVNALLRIQAIHQTSPGDRSLGALAVRRGLITRAQLDECLAEQGQLLRSRQEAPLLGIVLVEKKLLTNEQVKELLQIQAEQGQGPLAEIVPDRTDTALMELDERVYEEETAAFPTAQAPPDEEQAAPEPEEEEPPQEAGPTKTGEEISSLIVCRCTGCGHTEAREAWKAEHTCPKCQSDQFVPVPILGDAIGYSTADRSHGPSIEDSRLGRMAYFAGWLKPYQVRECLSAQRKAIEETDPSVKFGEMAVQMKLLTDSQVIALLRIQAIHQPVRHDETFGSIAVGKGFITRQQLDECLGEQKLNLQEGHEAPLLGILLEEKGLLTPVQVKAILGLQARYKQGPIAELEQALQKPSGVLESALERVMAGGSWSAYVSIPVLALSILMIVTGWFGSLSWQPSDVVVGCKRCSAVLNVATAHIADCPQCKAKRTLAPICRCDKCRHVFLFGALYAGDKCPKCGSKDLTTIESYEAAKRSWKLPPRKDLIVTKTPGKRR